jgi:hypothetical protein
MFYCEKCAKKNNWPTDFYLSQSYGICEICKEKATCFDVPLAHLPYIPNTTPNTFKKILVKTNGTTWYLSDDEVEIWEKDGSITYGDILYKVVTDTLY